MAKPISVFHNETTGVRKHLRPERGKPEMPDQRPPDARELGLNMTLAQVGVEMIAPLFVGLVIDHYADSSPWFTISGVILGFVGGVTHIIVLTRQQEAARRNKDKPGSGAP